MSWVDETQLRIVIIIIIIITNDLSRFNIICCKIIQLLVTMMNVSTVMFT